MQIHTIEKLDQNRKLEISRAGNSYSVMIADLAHDRQQTILLSPTEVAWLAKNLTVSVLSVIAPEAVNMDKD